jgi:hypothetical protein
MEEVVSRSGLVRRVVEDVRVVLIMGKFGSTHTHTHVKTAPALKGMGFCGHGYGYL